MTPYVDQHRDPYAINPLPGERTGHRYVDTGNPYANVALYSRFPPPYQTGYRVAFKLKEHLPAWWTKGRDIKAG